ncbi:MAG: SusC/RagA family TonB-linked outer membrane protein [Marinifilaceae bacterium]|nr:SusC/RagA family TonB-linked outer membrane protein [Marinifilaceae bacterium]
MKKDHEAIASGGRKWRKMTLIMKLKFILLLFMSVQLSAAVHSQTAQVTLKMSNVTLEQVLWEIQKQTDFVFMYGTSDIAGVTGLNVDMASKTVEEILDYCLKGTKLRYEISGTAVVIKMRDEEKKKQLEIKGVVKDSKNQPLPGVTVIEKGTSVGVATDVNGRFVFVTTQQDSVVLLFSFVGMKTREVIWKGQKELNVKLEEETQAVDEVVVTGYQTVTKRSMAGSVTVVRAEDLVLNGTQTLEQALQGKIPGMMVMNRSGLTGTRQRVRVRGTSTLLGNAEPVWVVDGVIQEDPIPFETNDLTNLDPSNMDMIRNFIGGAVSWLNPSDIDNVTVLKDAASTAIYGVKAANGVIVITTKRGQVGRMSVGYNGNFTVTPRLTYNEMELMNSQQRVEVSREAYNNGIPLAGNQNIGYMALAKAYKNREISLEEFSERVKQLERNNTDWFDILFRTAFSHSHNVSISGGSNKATYRASFGYTSNYNTARGNDQESYMGNVNVSANLWDNIQLTTSLAGSVQTTRGFAGEDPFTYATTMNRAIPAYNEDGSRFFYNDATNGFLFNVENELEHSGNENTMNSLNASMNLRWRLYDDLYYNTSFSYAYSSTSGEVYYDEQTNHVAELRKYNFEEYSVGSDEYKNSWLPHGGEYTASENKSTTWSWRNQLEYTKVLADVHSVSLMLGHEMRGTNQKGSSLTAYGYMPDRGKIFVNLPPTVSEMFPITVNPYLQTVPNLVDTKSNFLSWYVTASYMFDNRYSFNASFRTDASNRFGQDKDTRWQPVWSFGLRWNVGFEPWMQGQDILSDMSLRVSYGFQGNVVENVSPDLIATVTTSETDYDYTLTLKNLPAPELKQERVSNVNLGIDLSLFKNKINGTFEWYSKKTTDMITDVDVAYEMGTSSRPMNGGEMTNRGWDASVSFVPVRTKDFMLSLSLNTSKTQNKVTSTIEPTGDWHEATTGNLNKDGYAISSFWAFRFSGLNPEHGGPEFDMTGRELVASVEDATLYMDYAGRLEPTFMGGISFSIRWKTWTLTSGLYLSTGNQTFMAPPSQEYTSIPSEYNNMSTEWLKRWRKPGDEDFTTVPSLPNRVTSAKEFSFINPVDPMKAITYKPYELYAYSTARVVDAWYLRCNNINLSYTVPTEKLPKLFQNISFQCSIANPFQIRSKDFKGRDPEVALGNQPLQRTLSFSVDLSF